MAYYKDVIKRVERKSAWIYSMQGWPVSVSGFGKCKLCIMFNIANFGKLEFKNGLKRLKSKTKTEIFYIIVLIE